MREQGLVGFQTGEEAVRKHSSEDKQALKGSSQTVATRPTRSVYKKRSEVESSVIRPPTSLIQGVPTRRRHHHTRDTANSKPSRRDSTKASDRTRQSIQEVNDLRGRDRTSFLGLRRCKQRVNSSSAPTSVSSAHTSSMATGNRRRSGSWTKKSSNFKSPTSPSVTSILSEITNASGGSSGSNSTVTQDSISRPKSQRPKRSSVAGSETRGRGRKESTSASRSISPAVTERPNVFAFMENDSTTTVGIPARTATTVDDVIEEESGQSELPDVLSESEPEDGDNTSPSVGSHFGVSVPDDSPARLAETGKPQDEHAGQHYTRSQPAYHNAFSPSRTVDRRRPTSANSPPTGGVRRWSSASDSGMGSSVDENCGYDQPISSPEAYYRRPYPKPALRPDEDSPPYSLPDKHMPQQVLERPQVLQANWPKSNITGYELLASNLSSSSRGTDTLTPIYRKFETLNNRILLYLQDEISEIEEDLRKLDEADAQACAAMSGMTEEGGPVPTSRRLEARMPSEIHFRRLELLGRTFLKVGQYNQALSSYSGLIKGLDAAKGADIEAYQAWIDQHSTIVESETEFLTHKADLLALTSRTSRGRTWRGASLPLNHAESAPAYMAIVVSGAAVLIPLLSFSVISEFFGRLFVIIVVAGVATAMIAPSRAGSFMNWGELRPCLAVYAGILVLVAGILR